MQGVLPLDEGLRCKTGVAALERVATSTLLDCIVCQLLPHYHNKATTRFLTLDMVSPDVTHAEVRALYAVGWNLPLSHCK